MKDPRLNEFIKFFNSQGIKFVDEKTGEEIKPTNIPNIECPFCGSDIPENSIRCMWCKNEIKEK